MRTIGRVPLTAVVLMTVVSLLNVFGVRLAGMSVVIGVVFFFLTNALEKQSVVVTGLDLKGTRIVLENPAIWLWMVLPLVMNGVCLTVSRLFFPDFLKHILNRTELSVSFGRGVLLILQLAVLAIGEEIAWRAFFQKQLSKSLSVVPALLITSTLFAFAHFMEGTNAIVLFDLIFVFINSVLYGVIFSKTKNAWVSAISHFAANVFAIVMLGLWRL